MTNASEQPTDDSLSALAILQANLNNPASFARQLFNLNYERTKADDPELAKMMRACAIPRSFNADVIGVLRDQPEVGNTNQRLLAGLLTFSFVLPIQGSSDYTYHDNTREMLLDEWQLQENHTEFDQYKARLVAFYQAEGEAAYKGKLYENALAAFNRAIELQPGTGVLYNRRGQTHLKLGAYQAALTDLEKAQVDYAEDIRDYINTHDNSKEFSHLQPQPTRAGKPEISILIVDDHVLFREGIASLLNAQADITVLGQASSVQEATTLANELQPDLVLMDFGLPDGTGLDATKAILAMRPKTKIVFLTVHEDDERLFEAIRTGAKGYLLKNVHVSKLLAFLRDVERGEVALMPDMTNRILHEFVRLADPPKQAPPEFEALSAHEAEIVKQLATGATNQEIAERLFISENSVKNDVRNILAKLDLQSRRQIAQYLRSRL